MDHNHGDMGDGGDEGCKMIMTFHGGACEYILFSKWVANTTGKFVGATIAVFFFAVLYEGLKYMREKWFHDYQMKLKDDDSANISNTFRKQILNPHHIAQTLLHFIQATASYALMLIVMTYNVWLFFAAILGITVGYFFFGWLRNRTMDVTEHCH